MLDGLQRRHALAACPQELWRAGFAADTYTDARRQAAENAAEAATQRKEEEARKEAPIQTLTAEILNANCRTAD